MGVLKSSFIYVSLICGFILLRSECILSKKLIFEYEDFILNITILLPYVLGLLFFKQAKDKNFFITTFILFMIFFILVYVINLTCIYHDFDFGFGFLSWIKHSFLTTIFYIFLLGMSVLSLFIINFIRSK